MLSTRRDPWAGFWSELGRVQHEMNRLFDREGWFRAMRGTGPLVNLWEDDQNVYAETDLPGIPLEKLEIYVKGGNQLTIQAERPAPEQGEAVWHRQERPWGQFTRVVTLPAVVDSERVEANLEQGVLRLTLPKSEAAKPRKIAVKGN